MYIPSGSRTSISGPGPLREMVTSCRLGSKGILHVCSPPSSWSVDSRCTLEAWIADSTHFSTWGADVRSRCQRAPVMSCLCLTYPRQVPNRLPAVCRIRFPQWVLGSINAFQVTRGHSMPRGSPHNQFTVTLLACGRRAMTRESRRPEDSVQRKGAGRALLLGRPFPASTRPASMPPTASSRKPS